MPLRCHLELSCCQLSYFAFGLDCLGSIEIDRMGQADLPFYSYFYMNTIGKMMFKKLCYESLKAYKRIILKAQNKLEKKRSQGANLRMGFPIVAMLLSCKLIWGEHANGTSVVMTLAMLLLVMPTAWRLRIYLVVTWLCLIRCCSTIWCILCVIPSWICWSCFALSNGDELLAVERRAHDAWLYIVSRPVPTRRVLHVGNVTATCQVVKVECGSCRALLLVVILRHTFKFASESLLRFTI